MSTFGNGAWRAAYRSLAPRAYSERVPGTAAATEGHCEKVVRWNAHVRRRSEERLLTVSHVSLGRGWINRQLTITYRTCDRSCSFTNGCLQSRTTYSSSHVSAQDATAETAHHRRHDEQMADFIPHNRRKESGEVELLHHDYLVLCRRRAQRRRSAWALQMLGRTPTNTVRCTTTTLQRD